MASPALPLYPTTAPVAIPQALKASGPTRQLYSSAPASAPLTAANKENAGVYAPSGWSAAAQSSTGRLSAAAFLAANSKPAAAPPSLAPTPAPIPTFQYSYPSGPAPPSSQPSSAQSAPTSSSSTNPSSDPYNVPSVYLHRPHNASIIAAKKHVRRRPLGSHAPLARTPSLKNTFEWPPSPPKAGTRGGSATLTELAERGSRCAGLAEDERGRRGLFADAKGETVALRADAQRKRSTTPTTLAVPSATLEAAASKPVLTPVSKARAKDELLCHMESDPPTASSPAGPPVSQLTRRALSARDEKDAEEDDDEVDQLASDGEDAIAQAAPRPALARSMSASFAFPGSVPVLKKTGATFQRAQSLGRTVSHGAITSVSASSSLDTLATTAKDPTLDLSSSSRAGAGLACAIEALGRKRARILEKQASIPPPALVPSTTATGVAQPVRHSSVLGQRKSAKNNVFVSQAKSLTLLSGGRKSAAAGLSLDLSSAATTTTAAPIRAPPRKKRRVSSESVSTATTIEEDDFAELSFSSNSTASTVDSLATISDEPESTLAATGYFALPVAAAGKSAAVGFEDKALEDEQRECAELLLGLGGFC